MVRPRQTAADAAVRLRGIDSRGDDSRGEEGQRWRGRTREPLPIRNPRNRRKILPMLEGDGCHIEGEGEGGGLVQAEL